MSDAAAIAKNLVSDKGKCPREIEPDSLVLLLIPLLRVLEGLQFPIPPLLVLMPLPLPLVVLVSLPG